MTTLLIIAGVIAVMAGVRRSRYDGIPPLVWWGQERMYRRRRAIGGRALRVLLAVALAVGAFMAAAMVLLTVVAAAVVIAVLLAVWFYLRQGAIAAEPVPSLAERLASGELQPEDLDRFGGYPPPSRISLAVAGETTPTPARPPYEIEEA
ncbi:hypothetical protein AB0F17_08125 [Nonomuraea sp. NPDC026600]|uniref:hypothetical protein n=1 Tax=Nonomuraea sp. NPDC026600 TaxID=3155363 RepID=UPI0033D00D13